MSPKVVFVDGDDWEGLYINGVLVDEGHRVRLEDVMCRLGIHYNAMMADQEWLEAVETEVVQLEDFIAKRRIGDEIM